MLEYHIMLGFMCTIVVTILITVIKGEDACNNIVPCPQETPFCTAAGCTYRCPENSFMNGTQCVLHCGDGVADGVTCKDACPTDKTITFEEIRVVESKFQKIRFCLSSCNSYDANLLSYEDKCVYRCPKDFEFAFDNKCVPDCLDTHPFKDKISEDRVDCVESCPLNRSYDRNMTCVTDCRPGEVLLDKTCIENCPNSSYFIYQKKCVVECPYNMYRTNNSCTFQCRNISSSNPKFIYGRWCIDQCPDEATYYINIFGEYECVKVCKDFYVDKECVNKCPDETLTANKACVQTCPVSLPYTLLEKHTDSHWPYSTTLTKRCVSSCPDNMLYNNKTCTESCLLQLSNRTCVDKCPVAYPFSSYTTNDKIPKCVTECPINSFRANLTCVERCPHVSYGKACVPSCPNATLKDNYECVPDCSENKLYYGKECVSVCPKGTKVFIRTCIDKCPNEMVSYQDRCVYKCPENTLYDAKECVTNCPIEKHIYNQRCVLNCPEAMLKYNDKCVHTCPKDTLYNGHECVGHCPVGKSVYNRTCVTNCPEYTFKHKMNCVLDCPNNTYYFGKECAERCPKTNFVLNRTCVESCPPDSPIMYDPCNMTYCYRRRDQYYPVMCVDQCPDSFSINFTCVRSCFLLGTLVYNNECVEECPFDKPFISYSILIASYECSDGCAEGLTANGTVCLACKRPVLFDGQCLDACPEGMYWVGSSVDSRGDCWSVWYFRSLVIVSLIVMASLVAACIKFFRLMPNRCPQTLIFISKKILLRPASRKRRPSTHDVEMRDHDNEQEGI